MRVLIVNTLYPPEDVGGAERSVAQLAEGLAAAGVETAVLTLSSSDIVEQTVRGVAIHRRRLKNLYWPYGGQTRAAAKRALWHGLEAANPLMDGGWTGWSSRFGPI